MTYSLDRLNSMITSEELFIESKKIMTEYQEAIDKLMSETIRDDVKELAQKINPETMADIEKLAGEETARRMAKYGAIFFEEEIERLMDAYNDGEYDTIEFKMRCEILAGLKDSLTDYDPKNIEDNLRS
jgi:predicted lipid-binding transport protein (Tim44 family)